MTKDRIIRLTCLWLLKQFSVISDDVSVLFETHIENNGDRSKFKRTFAFYNLHAQWNQSQLRNPVIYYSTKYFSKIPC